MQIKKTKEEQEKTTMKMSGFLFNWYSLASETKQDKKLQEEIIYLSNDFSSRTKGAP